MRGLFIPVTFDLKTARQSLQSLVTESRKVGDQAGKATGEEFLKEFKTAFTTKSNAIKEAVARGFIDKSEARRLGQEAAKEFNAGITSELDRMRAAGKTTTAEFEKLQRSLKSVGTTGSAAMREATGAANLYERSLGSLKGVLGGIFAYFTARTVFNFFKDSMEQASEASRSWGVLAANVEAAGVSFTQVQPEIEKLAASVQKTTRFSDEEFADALSNVITITNDYSRSLKSMDVVLDLAAAKQLDLHTASQVVGKAIVGNTTQLQKMGIVVHEGADAVQLMRDRFHGLAEKDGATLDGRLKSLNNLWGEFKEGIGAAILGSDSAADSIGDMKDALIKATDWVNRNAAAFETWIGVIARVGSALANLAIDWARILDPAGMQAGAERATQQAQGNAGDPAFLRALLKEQELRRQNADANIDRLNKELAVQEKLNRARRSDSLSKAELDTMRQIRDATIEQETALLRIKQVRADLAKAMEAKGPPIKDKPLEETDAQKAKREAREKAAEAARQKVLHKAEEDAKKRLDVEERLQDWMAKLAVTTTDTMLLEIGRLEKDWLATHDKMDEATAKSFAALRKFAADTTQVEAFTKQLHEMGQVEVKTAADAEMLTNQVGDFIRTLSDEAGKFEEGSKMRDLYNKLIEEAIKLQVELAAKEKSANEATIKSLDEQNKKLEEKKEKLRDQARAVEEYARSIIQVAEAFGVLDDQAAKALESVVQIGTAIARVAGGDLTAIPSLLGGIASLASSIFGGGDDRADEARKAQQELIKSLNDLSENIKNTMSGKGPLQSATESIAADVFEKLRIAKPRGSATATPTLADARATAAERLGFIRTEMKFKPTAERAAAIAELEKLIREIDDFVERMTRAVNKDLDNREVAAKGYDYELQRRELASLHEAELRDAELAGLDTTTIARMKYVQGLEDEAQAQAEAAVAAEFGVALLERQARLSGTREDAIAAAQARAQLVADNELATAKRLLDQGVITQEMFDALAKVLGEDVVDAVVAAQAAFDDLAESFSDSLSVRRKKVSGDDKGAQTEELQHAQRDELKKARDLLSKGVITQEQFDALVQLQADEMAAFLKSLEDEIPAIAAQAATSSPISDGALGKTIESVTGITGTQAVGILDYQRTSIGIAQSQLEELRSIRQILSGSGRAEGGPVAARRAYIVGEKGPELFMPGQYGHILPDVARSVVGAPTVNIDSTINFHGGVGNPNAVAQEISAQIVSKMNTALGTAALREKRLSGDVML